MNFDDFKQSSNHDYDLVTDTIHWGSPPRASLSRDLTITLHPRLTQNTYLGRGRYVLFNNVDIFYDAGFWWLAIEDVYMPLCWYDTWTLTRGKDGTYTTDHDTQPLQYDVIRKSRTNGDAIRKQIKEFMDWLKTIITLSNGRLQGSIFAGHIKYARYLSQVYRQDARSVFYNQAYPYIEHKFSTPVRGYFVYDSSELHHITRDSSTTVSQASLQGSLGRYKVEFKGDTSPDIFSHRLDWLASHKTLFALLTHPDTITSIEVRIKVLALLCTSLLEGRYNFKRLWNTPHTDHSNASDARKKALGWTDTTRMDYSLEDFSYEVNLSTVRTFINKIISTQKGAESSTIVTVKADKKFRCFINK